jgi:dihydrofolate reductase
MGKIILGMTISLDGFVNDQDGSVGRLYADLQGVDYSEQFQEAIQATGAVIMGRRSYEMGDGDFTGYEFQVPLHVVTHQVPEQVAKGENKNMKFVFVTDGVESAVSQAKRAAGDKDVTVVGGADIIQQILNAGLADELHIDIIPVLLGDGLRLFDHIENAPVELEQIQVDKKPKRTSFRYRIVK